MTPVTSLSTAASGASSISGIVSMISSKRLNPEIPFWSCSVNSTRTSIGFMRMLMYSAYTARSDAVRLPWAIKYPPAESTATYRRPWKKLFPVKKMAIFLYLYFCDSRKSRLPSSNFLCSISSLANDFTTCIPESESCSLEFMTAIFFRLSRNALPQAAF